METIKNYLDSMFGSLPDTMEVKKAREELYQMMEDKYLELKGEGKSENEAIGIVITEFGNLDEIIKELGIQNKEMAVSHGGKEPTYVSMSQAKEYLDVVKKYAIYIALGVMLCICSPVTLVFLGGYSEVSALNEEVAGFAGLIVLFILIAVGVVLFIYTGSQLSQYEYLKKEVIRLDRSTELYIKEEQRRNRPSYSIKIAIGVVLCIISVIPVLYTGFFFSDFAAIVAVCMLLLMIAISVLFFVTAGMQEDAYKILLQEGDYEKKKKGKVAEAISSVYWCVVTAIYLGWSFITFKWGVTWIIWPVAGLLYGAIMAIYNVARKES